MRNKPPLCLNHYIFFKLCISSAWPMPMKREKGYGQDCAGLGGSHSRYWS